MYPGGQFIGAFVISQQDQRAGAVVDDGLQGGTDGPALRGAGFQHRIQQPAMHLDPDRHWPLGIQGAMGQRQVSAALGHVVIYPGVEQPLLQLQSVGFDAFQGRVMPQAELDQVRDGADLEVMLPGEGQQVR